MAQHDYIIANQSGAAFRADLNNSLAAIVSQNSGAAQPSTTYAYQWWADTTTGLLKIRNAANNAWITLFQLDGEWTTLALENGTAAAPSLYFKDSGTDTGLFSPGTNQLGIATNGVECVRFDSSARLLVGATVYRSVGDAFSPTSAIFNEGSGTTDYQILAGVHNRASIEGPQIALGKSRGATNGSVTIVQSGDHLGEISFAGADGVDLETRAALIRAEVDGTPGADDMPGRLLFATTADGASSPTERARIDSSGRLLVGTTAALEDSTSPVHIKSSSFLIHGHTNGDAGHFARFDNSVNGPFFFLQKSRSSTLGTHAIVQSGDSLGGVLFAGSDGTNFTVGGTIQCQVDGTPGANDMPGRLLFSTTSDGASSTTARMLINSAGVVAFQNQTANSGTGSRFEPNTENVDRLVMLSAGTGATTLQVFGNNNGTIGTITTSGSATAYNTSSDYRLKENVTPVPDGITRLQQLKPSRFNFITDPDKTVDGFLAHEAQAVVPECVTGIKDAVDEDGNPVYQGIDQSKLVPLLTAALQEAIGEIESLKARVAALEP
jgi:hypothetical protein